MFGVTNLGRIWNEISQQDLTILLQATAQMAADKEAVGLSSVHMCESKCGAYIYNEKQYLISD